MATKGDVDAGGCEIFLGGKVGRFNAVKCNGKYRVCGDVAPFEIGDAGFAGEASFTEGCLSDKEDGINVDESGD